MHLPQVSPSYVYSFESYRVDKHKNPKNKQTNKQTDAAENISSNVLRYVTTFGNNIIRGSVVNVELKLHYRI